MPLRQVKYKRPSRQNKKPRWHKYVPSAKKIAGCRWFQFLTETIYFRQTTTSGLQPRSPRYVIVSDRNFIPGQNTGLGMVISSAISASFDYSYDDGFQHILNGSKNTTHIVSDFVLNVGFGALSNPIGKKRFNELAGLKREADQLYAKFNKKAQRVLYNYKGFRNPGGKYNSYSKKASNMLDQSYKFGSQITNAAVLGITDLGRAFRHEAAKDLTKNKVLNE